MNTDGMQRLKLEAGRFIISFPGSRTQNTLENVLSAQNVIELVL